MKLRKISLFAILALTMAAWPAATQATLIYVDAVGDIGGNTVRASDDAATGWFTAPDGINTPDLWTFRTTGPGALAFGNTAYQGSEAGLDSPPLKTTVTGLTPNTPVGELRIYFIGHTGSGTDLAWPIDYSLNGTNWTTIPDVAAVQSTAVAVDTANGGLGDVVTPALSGDARFYQALTLPGGFSTSGAGTLSLWVRPTNATGGVPSLGVGSRSVYDGLAYSLVPEPGTLAIAGAGLVLILVNGGRNRKRGHREL